ncbi:MAG: hypothetical protein QM760_23035 [Nibricoccus sp.]
MHDLDRWDRLLAGKVVALKSAYAAHSYRQLRQTIALQPVLISMAGSPWKARSPASSCDGSPAVAEGC